MRRIEEIINEGSSFINSQKGELQSKLSNLQVELDLSSVVEYCLENDLDYNKELLQYYLENIKIDDFYFRESNGNVIFKISSKLNRNDFYTKFISMVVKKYDIKLLSINELISK